MDGIQAQALAFDPHAQCDAMLERLVARGFEHAQVRVWEDTRRELNVAHNEPALLRSTETRRVAATGIVDGRRASADGNDLSDAGLAALVETLWDSARSAPQDAANAVSSGQRLTLARGPREADAAMLAQAVRALLAWRAAHTPSMMIEEAVAAHSFERAHVATTGGSAITTEIGSYDCSVFGLARDGTATSSFNYTGGSADALGPVPEQFGVGEMMRALTRQVHTAPFDAPFVGEVVLTPGAVGDLIDWLDGQLGDSALITGSSLYRTRVGERIASPLLTLESRYDASGCAPVTADAFVAAPVRLLDGGRLVQLTPSFYGSRKTGIAHHPVAGSGWRIVPGQTPLAEMIAAVPRGALVDRLSMGNPAPNGDFSGVVKNSFRIDDGQVGGALAETMIAGNVARMLLDIVAVSRESLDQGAVCWPWLRIGGLNFS